MDALFFKTNNKDDMLAELGLHEDSEKDNKFFFNGSLYEGDDFILSWIGKIPDTFISAIDSHGDEVKEVLEYKDGEHFNIFVKGQKAMDRFYHLKMAERIDPVTPNLNIY